MIKSTPMVVSYYIHNILPSIVLHKVDFPEKEGPTTAILRTFLSDITSYIRKIY